MHTMFIEARYSEKFKLTQELVDRLPDTITLATTVQFLDSLDAIKKQLEDADIKVKLFKGAHAKYAGQILGCSLNKQEDTDAFLYIGTGEFHPKALLLANNKPVFSYNPLSEQFEQKDMKDIEKINKRKTGALLRYMNAKNVGIIVSTKPGQNNLSSAEALKQKLSSEGKGAYIFVTDILNFNEFENFPFVDCWVNTACPRIAYDDVLCTTKPLINIVDLPD
jgi:2-(3-amino-3-carboxypropyl)histidine synthase